MEAAANTLPPLVLGWQTLRQGLEPTAMPPGLLLLREHLRGTMPDPVSKACSQENILSS